MVDVLLLDLGGTLVDGNGPLPNVADALAVLRRFTGGSGRPLQLALVSDFLPADPPTPVRVKARFTEYLGLLDGFGLRKFFQPVGRHVTLSTHAGVNKPDRRVYELALERLGTAATLAGCLSITEDPGQVAACKALGMRALRFGDDFADWADGPLLVRHVVDPTNASNTALALGVWLAARHGRRLAGLVGAPTIAGVAIRLRPPGPERAAVAFDGEGRVAELAFDDDGPDVAAFHRSRREHGQLAPPGDDPLPSGATHRVESDERGRPVVKGSRFSAI